MKRPKHRKWIGGLPCLVCGAVGASHAAHIRFSEPKVGKMNPGIGDKSDDAFTLPLCQQCHIEDQHKGSEREYWRRLGIDPHYVALALWHASEDIERSTQICETWRPAL